MPISKTDPVEQFPFMGDDEEETRVQRFQPIPTPASLKSKALFGIPLRSSLTQENITDEALQSWINEAISELEHTLDLYITPVTFVEKHDYLGQMWRNSFAYIKLNHSNVITVNRVQLTLSNDGTGAIEFPLEHVHLQPHDATIQLVPAFGTSLSGYLLSTFSGSNYHALNAAAAASLPGAVRITYTAGFPEDKVPAMLTNLIENMAALNALSVLGPLLFPFSSVSINIDGMGQSTGNAGPAFLAGRIADLKEQVERGMTAAKGYYNRKFLVDYF